MTGYICIAMLVDPPYNMILAATEDEPAVWLEKLPLPSHLLCYESFQDVQAIERQCLIRLKAQGIEAIPNKAFAAKAYEVMQVYQLVRDGFIANPFSNNVDDEVIGQDEGERLYELAEKLDFDDPEKLELLKRASVMRHTPAMLKLAEAYLLENPAQALEIAERIKINDFALNNSRGYEMNSLGNIYRDLAEEYDFGSDFVIADPKKAQTLYKKAAAIYLRLANSDLEYKDAAYLTLCYFYRDGNGVKKDLNEALKWAMKNAETSSVFGFEVASEILLSAGQQERAEAVWRKCFTMLKSGDDQVLFKHFLWTKHPYQEQVENGKIAPVHTKEDVKFICGLAKSVKKIKNEEVKKGYKKFIEWLGTIKPVS